MPDEPITSPYVSYAFYTGEYLGNKISSEELFDRHEKRAEAVLHRITFDRVKRLDEIPESVKYAICAMAETHYQESQKKAGVKSENIDGYDVTYAESGATAGETGIAKLMYQAAATYLSTSGLLFKGRSRRYDY